MDSGLVSDLREEAEALRLVFFVAVVVLLLAASAPARTSDGAGITGTITLADGRTILVEEEPYEGSGSDKSYVEVTEETEISLRRPGEVVPAAFEDLSVGRRVEVVFGGAVAESYPTRARAGSVVVLEDGSGELSDTSGGGGGGGTLWAGLLVVCLLGCGVWSGIRPRA
jgi:hypothetical protein